VADLRVLEDVGILDQAYVPAAILNTQLRRRLLSDRAAV
jgi:hypothetical protein